MFWKIDGRGSEGSGGFGLLSTCAPVGLMRASPPPTRWTTRQSSAAVCCGAQTPGPCPSSLRRWASASASARVMGQACSRRRGKASAIARAIILAAGRGQSTMSRITSQISISLDGFAAGPKQSSDNPLGEGGEGLHEWPLATESWKRRHGYAGGERNADSEVIEEVAQGVGAYVMGRNMFGGGPGPWDESWKGWWGDDPPFHTPVYVLPPHAREPLEMEGGTTFHFVTDGIESALEQARAAAGDE